MQQIVSVNVVTEKLQGFVDTHFCFCSLCVNGHIVSKTSQFIPACRPLSCRNPQAVMQSQTPSNGFVPNLICIKNEEFKKKKILFCLQSYWGVGGIFKEAVVLRIS